MFVILTASYRYMVATGTERKHVRNAFWKVIPGSLAVLCI
jgi:hypothetical protein